MVKLVIPENIVFCGYRYTTNCIVVAWTSRISETIAFDDVIPGDSISSIKIKVPVPSTP